MRSPKIRVAAAIVLALSLLGGIAVQIESLAGTLGRTHIVAYFDNSNGLYTGDEVRILGVAVGSIDRIEAEPDRVKITFWVDDKYPVPADAAAAIISPQLVTSRAIQLTPVYDGGPQMPDGAVILQDRTAVPLEWDDLRDQLEKLTLALQPTEHGGVSTLGAFVTTAADNLRGQGADIRDTLLKLSQALSVLGDHSTDMFSSVRNLSVVVAALEDSSQMLVELNGNLDTVTGLLTKTPGAVGAALDDLGEVVGEATRFIADNREALGVTTDKVTSITTAVHESLDDVEQSLHIFPNTLQNFVNIYQPTQQGITGALTLQNFANPISFLCGGIQAASKLNAEQSAKLCAQYLAPIIKNRQFNFVPLGANYLVGEAARPNEITYSEDWLRPDFIPPASADTTPVTGSVRTDPAAGLPGLMVPPGGGG